MRYVKLLFGNFFQTLSKIKMNINFESQTTQWWFQYYNGCSCIILVERRSAVRLATIGAVHGACKNVTVGASPALIYFCKSERRQEPNARRALSTRRRWRTKHVLSQPAACVRRWCIYLRVCICKRPFCSQNAARVRFPRRRAGVYEWKGDVTPNAAHMHSESAPAAPRKCTVMREYPVAAPISKKAALLNKITKRTQSN